jgi:hypothetical protein
MNNPEQSLLENLSVLVGAVDSVFTKVAEEEESVEEAAVESLDDEVTETDETDDDIEDTEDLDEDTILDDGSEKTASAGDFRLLMDNPHFSQGVCERITERGGDLEFAISELLTLE